MKFKYLSSRFHEPKNLLMLGFLVMAEDGVPVPDANELDEAKWFTLDEAMQTIKKDSLAEAFLKSALPEIKKL